MGLKLFEISGKMSFTMKVMAAMQGGIDKIMGRVYEKV
jgi:hypothetical protein